MDHKTWATSFAADLTESGFVGSRSMAEAGSEHKFAAKSDTAVQAWAARKSFIAMVTCMCERAESERLTM